MFLVVIIYKIRISSQDTRRHFGYGLYGRISSLMPVSCRSLSVLSDILIRLTHCMYVYISVCVFANLCMCVTACVNMRACLLFTFSCVFCVCMRSK